MVQCFVRLFLRVCKTHGLRRPRHNGGMLQLTDIEAAARRLQGQVLDTPFVESRTLSQLLGCTVFLKFENLQYTASFKERGACNKLSQLDAAERARGVVAMSAGNHAQGVAYHAQRLGLRAVIVMPRFTPGVKIERARGLYPADREAGAHPVEPDLPEVAIRREVDHGEADRRRHAKGRVIDPEQHEVAMHRDEDATNAGRVPVAAQSRLRDRWKPIDRPRLVTHHRPEVARHRVGAPRVDTVVTTQHRVLVGLRDPDVPGRAWEQEDLRTTARTLPERHELQERAVGIDLAGAEDQQRRQHLPGPGRSRQADSPSFDIFMSTCYILMHANHDSIGR